MTINGTATLVEKVPTTDGLTAAIYRMDPPLEGHELVLISTAIDSTMGMTTCAQSVCIFPVVDLELKTFDGSVTLPGTTAGELDHGRALAAAGYGLIKECV